MNISAPFIKRPIMTTLVMIAVLVFGILSYKVLPVGMLPNVEYPTISVSVGYPGARPQTMSTTCAVPLEREFMTIEGVKTITSSSTLGGTSIVMQFNLDRSLDSASIDVEAAINRAIPNLPSDLPYNPTYRKVNTSDSPIYYLALTSDNMTLSELYDYGNTYLGKKMAVIEGVSQVQTFGAPYAARIQIDTERLASIGMSLDEISLAIREGNVELPTGNLFGPKTEFTLDVNGQLLNAKAFNNLVIKAKDGSIVKIDQIGEAKDSLENDKYYLHYLNKTTNKPCILLAVRKQPGKNTVAVVKKIKEELPKLKKQLPKSLEYHYIFDQADIIKDAVLDVEITLIIAFILVIAVIFLSLGKLMHTVIPSLSLPIAIFGTFAIISFAGYTINIFSLLAITLSIGFLVDDSIVVLENNVRHVQLGEDPFTASMNGAKEISFTILSMTLCLVAVFIPLLFMDGIIGRIFREFSVTIIVAVAFSGFVALSLSPMLSSRFISPNKKEKERYFDKISRKTYEKVLTWSFAHKKIMLAIGLGCVSIAGFLFVELPKDFLPSVDYGFLQGFTECRNGTSPHKMGSYQNQISEILVKDPAVDEMVSVAATGSGNEGFAFIKLLPYKQRDDLFNVLYRIMGKINIFAGVNSYISHPPLISLQTGSGSKGQYQYSLTSINQAEINKYSEIFLDKLKDVDGLAQVSSNLQIKQPQVEIEVLRDRASDLNISVMQLENFLNLAYSGGRIGTIKKDINQYDVILETLPKFYKDPTVLSSLYLRSKTNKLVPFTEVINVKKSAGPLTVNHTDGIPSSTISFDVRGIALSKALEKVSDIADEVLPKTISGGVQGAANVFKQSFKNLNILFLITIFVIYIILGILYENLIHPITVLSTLPPATFGGLLSLFIFNQTFSLYSFVGLILLIGIVLKNGILMVDVANINRVEKKMSIQDAIYNACIVRFRPIMMTSIAAFMGALPIALGIGGSAAKTRISLGICITGGLFISQFLTLVLTPVIYYYMQLLNEKLESFFKKRKARA